jgi:hypothetical protein
VRKNRHVVPNDGGWKVTGGGKGPTYDTQGEAIDAARKDLKRSGGGELNIHGRDGRIRSKDSVSPGNDPYPPKG